MNAILFSALFIHVTTVGSALAGGKSDLGIAEWQPRQAVLIKLEADRRQLRSIKTDDGWSDAVESKGLEVETHFDLKTWPVWVVPAKELRINRCATTRVWNPCPL
ncbi:PepSY domain-containing protein (plasmid) [Mesorhizobium sp. AR07]|uniref:PepSY domain-containing protein n=1 Tax=Mesorhizobium sp. AR07 TaxID=2865838 RepID=UPI00215E84C5|nr:PepSY domain-containing protein [Mesorhizobium sp. AR07]UVK49108.1 PepSY domain-containing protein [Mesorhizobium sp. AR07]